MCCAAGSIWFGRVGGRGTACEQCNIIGILWQRCNTHFHSLKWAGYNRSSGAGKQGSGTQHILHSPIFLQFFFFAFFSSSFFCVSFKLLLVCFFFVALQTFQILYINMLSRSLSSVIRYNVFFLLLRLSLLPIPLVVAVAISAADGH